MQQPPADRVALTQLWHDPPPLPIHSHSTGISHQDAAQVLQQLQQEGVVVGSYLPHDSYIILATPAISSSQALASCSGCHVVSPCNQQPATACTTPIQAAAAAPQPDSDSDSGIKANQQQQACRMVGCQQRAPQRSCSPCRTMFDAVLGAMQLNSASHSPHQPTQLPCWV